MDIKEYRVYLNHYLTSAIFEAGGELNGMTEQEIQDDVDMRYKIDKARGVI